jgi:hypothetical protein
VQVKADKDVGRGSIVIVVVGGPGRGGFAAARNVEVKRCKKLVSLVSSMRRDFVKSSTIPFCMLEC